MNLFVKPSTRPIRMYAVNDEPTAPDGWRIGVESMSQRGITTGRVMTKDNGADVNARFVSEEAALDGIRTLGFGT